MLFDKIRSDGKTAELWIANHAPPTALSFQSPIVQKSRTRVQIISVLYADYRAIVSKTVMTYFPIRANDPSPTRRKAHLQILAHKTEIICTQVALLFTRAVNPNSANRSNSCGK